MRQSRDSAEDNTNGDARAIARQRAIGLSRSEASASTARRVLAPQHPLSSDTAATEYPTPHASQTLRMRTGDTHRSFAS
jgi:hypothetical protein